MALALTVLMCDGSVVWPMYDGLMDLFSEGVTIYGKQSGMDCTDLLICNQNALYYLLSVIA